MRCQDFERIWDDILDAGNPPLGGRGPDMESPPSTSREQDLLQSLRDHAFGCADCRLRMSQFETLRRAIQSWEHAPKASPSTDLVDRILPAALNENAKLIPLRNRRLWSRYGFAGTAATAAAALLIALYPGHQRPRPLPGPRPNAPKQPPRVDLPALNQAIVEASDATWDLAYVASAPAVRLGRHVFDGTGSMSPEADESPGEVVSEVLSRFGQEISAGVRPLSDSARRAVKYLKDAVPPPGKPSEAAPRPDTKGT